MTLVRGSAIVLLSVVATSAAAQPITTISGNAIKGDCNAVGSNSHVTCNDVDTIRKALQPAVRSQLDRLLPNLEAQRKLLETIATRTAVKDGREHASISRQIADLKQIVVEDELGRSLEGWIDRAQRLESELSGPDTAPALALLRAGDLDGAEQALNTFQAQQAKSIERLEAVARAARHAQEVAEKELLEQRTKAAETSVRLGDLSDLKFDFVRAAAYYRAAIRAYRQLHDEGHRDEELLQKRALALLAVGSSYKQLSRWDEALRACQIAVAIFGKLASSRPRTFLPELARSLNDLARVLKATNRLGEAEPLLRRALAIDEASFSPADPTVARDLNNLAQLLQATNRLGEAEPLLRRALAIDEASLGPTDPIVAGNLNNLAQLLQETDRLGEAEPLMRRALAIDEASFGPTHPIVAGNLNNLAQLLQDTNRLDEAEPLMRRALAIDEATFGPRHSIVARDLGNLAGLLNATNRQSEAEPLMRRALAIDEASLGPTHPDVASDLNNLAQLLQATNRLGEAEPLMRRALAIDEASFVPTHPTIARDLNNLAQLLQATNRLSQAKPLLQRALDIFTGSFGAGHPWSRTVAANLHQLLSKVEAVPSEVTSPPRVDQ